jgi:hypothetical protein
VTALDALWLLWALSFVSLAVCASMYVGFCVADRFLRKK